VTYNYDGEQTKRVKWQKYFFHANAVSRAIIIVMKVLNWIILLIVTSSFQIFVQSPEDLRTERDQLVERGDVAISVGLICEELDAGLR